MATVGEEFSVVSIWKFYDVYHVYICQNTLYVIYECNVRFLARLFFSDDIIFYLVIYLHLSKIVLLSRIYRAHFPGSEIYVLKL